MRTTKILVLAISASLAACHMVVSLPTGKPAPEERAENEVLRRPAPSGDQVARRQPTGPLPRPRFWTWQQPLGLAASQGDIIKVVLQNTKGSPLQVADKVCDEIVRRRLKPGEVCIILQNFGMGDGDPARLSRQFTALNMHWCDGLAHRTQQDPRLGCERLSADADVERWWPTLWMSHGIAECRGWMDDFIAEYKLRQAADGRIPDPSRFHFDSEAGITPWMGGFEAFVGSRNDPRWGSEPIPGHGGKTLEDLYREAGEPRTDPSRHPNDPKNRAWGSWFMGICMQANDGAMNEAAYEPIRAAWPACKSSNYSTSSRADGRGDPRRLFQWQDWLYYANDAFGDLQAPVLYWGHPSLVRTGESRADAAIRKGRDIVDVCTHSFGGPHWDVVPWIELTGSARSRHGESLKVTPRMMREMLAMLRGRGVTEYIIWSNATTQKDGRDWNDFIEVIRQVWRTNVRGYRVETGGESGGGDFRALRFSRNDPLAVSSAPEGAQHRADIRIDFSSTVTPADRAAGDDLEIVVDAWTTDGPAIATLAIRDWSRASDDVVGTFAVSTASEDHREIDRSLSRHVAEDGSIQLLLTFIGPRPFTANIDSIQVHLTK